MLEKPGRLFEAKDAGKTKDRPGGRRGPELPSLPLSREASYRDFGGRAPLPIPRTEGTDAAMPDAIPNSDTDQRPPARKCRLDPDRAAIIRSAPPLVMDLMEASAYLVCSPRKLREFVATHRIKHARVGAKIVFRREWLDAFIDK